MFAQPIRCLLFSATYFLICVSACDAEESTPSSFISTNKAWSLDGTLLLELALVRPPNTTLESTVIELKVTNSGPDPIRLDRELIVGFKIRFFTDLDHRAADRGGPNLDDTSVRFRNVRKNPPDKTKTRDRFVLLESRQSLKRRIDFSEDFAMAGAGRNWFKTNDGLLVHDENFAEYTSRIEIPHDVRQIEIRAGYVTDYVPHLFDEWFGVNSRTHGVWNGNAGSAPLTISFN